MATARPSGSSVKPSVADCPPGCESPANVISATRRGGKSGLSCGNRSKEASHACTCRGSICFFCTRTGFRRLAAEFGVTPAALAHRYALSLDIDTLVLGVKNRQELAECVAAVEAGS